MSNSFTKGPAFITTDPVTVTWANRNRLTESVDAPLSWTDADQTPEDGQTAVIEVFDPAGTTVITTHSGLTGTSFDVPLSSFGAYSSGWISVGAERDGYREWEAYRIQVILTSLSLGAFTLNGGDARVGPMVVADAGSFAIFASAAQLILARSMSAAPGSFALTGNEAVLRTSLSISADTGSFTLIGNAATLTNPPPSFVNAGTMSTGSSNTITPTLPGSRVNGNLLIAVVTARQSTTISTSTAGWTKFDQAVGGSGTPAITTAIFYAYVTGSESAPVFTWGANGTYSARVSQYSGTLSSSPIGASNVASGTGSTIAVTGIMTTANNSLAIYLIGSRGTSADTAQPSGWTEDFDSTLTDRSTGGEQTMAASGGSTGNISISSGATAWAAWQIELKSN